MSARLATIFRCDSCGAAEGLPHDQRDGTPQGWLSLPAMPGLSRARTYHCEACAAILRGRMGDCAAWPERQTILQRRAS